MKQRSGKMKRFLAVLLVAAILIPTLAACGQSKPNNNGGDMGFSDDNGASAMPENGQTPPSDNADGNDDNKGNSEKDPEKDPEKEPDTEPEGGEHVHEFSDWLTVRESSCDVRGVRERSCECGKTEKEFTEIIGHTPDQIVFASGELCGKNAVGRVYCSTCKDLLETYGHRYVKMIIEPTCTENGSVIYTCSHCGDSYTDTISSVGHVEGAITVEKEATCVEEGRSVISCLSCHEVLESFVLETKPHMLRSVVNENTVNYSCSSCGHTHSEDVSDGYCTVKFNTNSPDIQIDDLVVKKGDRVEFSQLNQEGAEFLGWYLDSDCKNIYLSDPINYDIELYAAWAKKISGSTDTENIITDVNTDHVFYITSDIGLTDTELLSRVKVTDVSGKILPIYLKQASDGTYTVACDGYEAGESYSVTLGDGVSFADTEGRELWFVTKGENKVSVSYKDDVVKIQISDVCNFYSDGEFLYMVLYEDLLDAGDNVVIYGDGTEDIQMVCKAMSEEQKQTYYFYRVTETDAEDVFNEYELYYSGDIPDEDISLNATVTEDLTAAFMESPLYAQFLHASEDFAELYASSGRYIANGTEVKVKATKADGKIVFLFTVTSSFFKSSDPNMTLNFTMIFTSTLKYGMNVKVKSVKNFSFILNVDSENKIDLFVSNEKAHKKEFEYFRKLFVEKCEDGSIYTLEADSAKAAKEIEIGSIGTCMWGVTLTLDISNVFEFKAVGQVGAQINLSMNTKLGIRNSSGKFEFIRSFSADADTSLYVMAKLSLSDQFELEASVGLLGLVNAYISASVGPYFEMGGMFSVTADIDGGNKAIAGGYLEIGLNVDLKAGVNVKLRYWLFKWREKVLWEKTWKILDLNEPFISLGQKEMPLYFDDAESTYEKKLGCTDKLDLSGFTDTDIVIQDLSSMSLSSKSVTCEFYLLNGIDGVTLSRNGILTLDGVDAENLTLNVKVVYGSIYKLVSVEIELDHGTVYSVPFEDSTCYSTGHYAHTYCRTCGGVLIGDGTPIPVKSHEFEDDKTCKDRKCENCDHIEEASTAHSYSDWTVTVNPTCESEGEQIRSCGVCNKTETEAISAMGHAAILHEGRAATCTDGGWTAYETCERCDRNTRVDIEKLGHAFENTVCTRCGYEGDSEGIEYTLSDDGTYYTVTGIGTYEGTKLGISPEHNGLPVKAIGADAFRGKTSVTSVWIPDGIISIGSFAFEGCTALTSVVMTDSVTVIGDCAFDGCSSLSSINISSTVTSIGASAFYNCEALSYVSIPIGVTVIKESAFEGCVSLKSIELHKNIKTVGDYAFNGCSSLESVTFGTDSMLTEIGRRAFENCSALKGITVSSRVTDIGEKAFSGCSLLESVVFESSVGLKNLGKSAFYNCSALTGIDIPYGVSSIGDYTFEGCEKLKSISLPMSVTSIGKSAFLDCASLESVFISSNVTSIGSNAFENCTALSDVKFGSGGGSLSAGSNAFAGCTGLKEIILPDRLTSISSYMFKGCTALETVTISKSSSITAINSMAFMGCTALNMLYLPEGITTIGRTAFQNCTSLTSINIPSSVETVSSSAFSNCKALEAVYITDIASWCAISFGNNTANPLYYAKNLYVNGVLATEIEIPSTVTSIGNYAFYNCVSITSVKFLGTAEQWEAITKGTDWDKGMQYTLIFGDNS